MTHIPELFLAIVVISVVAFLTLNRTSTTPPISAEPPRALASTPTLPCLRPDQSGDAGD